MSKEQGKIGRRNGRLVRIHDGEVVEDYGRAINVDKYVTNVDTNEVTVYLSFEDDGRMVVQSLKRDEINDRKIATLTRYGADCWPEVAGAYTRNIRMQIAKMPRSFEHSNLGWGTYQGTTFFKLYEAVGFNSTYDNSRHDVKPTGSFDVWMQMVKNEVLGNRWLEWALAAGFTGPLLYMIREEANMDSLFINFYGVSSTGKTLATRLAVSPFGLPDTRKKGLLVSWYGTDQGILHTLRGNYGVPIGIDDTSLVEEGKDFTQFVYVIAGNLEKAALTAHGTKRKQEDWITTVFSSSEFSILQNTDQRSGVRVRLMEINEPSLTASAENAERIEQVVLKNYGHAGPIYVTHLMKIGQEKVFERWVKTRERLFQQMEEKDSFSKRIAGKLAVVQLAGELANEALNLGLDLEQLTDSLLHIEKKSVKTRNKGEEAYQFVMEYFVRNRHKFFRDRSDWDRSKPIVGKYIEKGGTVVEIRIPKDEFEKLMKQGKFDVEQVISLWKESGRLVHDEGKNTLTRVFQPGVPKIAQYAFKVENGVTANKQRDHESAQLREKETSLGIAKQKADETKAKQEHTGPFTKGSFTLTKGKKAWIVD